MSYVWPMALVVASNILYQICTKSVPEEIDPFASLIITYLVAAAACVVFYYVLGADGNLLKEFAGGKLHWTSFVLGIVIVGLEAGCVGYFLYHESLTWNKLLGVAICLVGLFFIKLR